MVKQQTLLRMSLAMGGGILGVIGAALLVTSLTLAYNQYQWLKQAEMAEGTVVELVQVGGWERHAPRVRFTTADGALHTFTREWSGAPEFAAGERVSVAYDSKTGEARIYTFWHSYGDAVFAGIAALPPLGIAWMFFWVFRKLRSHSSASMARAC
jgi:hypothetical protein